MLIEKPKVEEDKVAFSQMMKMATQFLPEEQVRKFTNFQDLIEKELMNEAREPEIENTIRDLFSALHEHNIVKLLKTLQGDKKKIFFAFKKQLETKSTLTKREAKILSIIEQGEVSLLTIALLKE